MTDLWILSSIIGVAASIYGLRSALLDLDAVGPLVNGRKMIAHQRVYSQAARLVAFICWSILGLFALTVPEQPFDPVLLLLLVPNALHTSIVLSDIYVGKTIREASSGGQDEKSLGGPPQPEQGSSGDN